VTPWRLSISIPPKLATGLVCPIHDSARVAARCLTSSTNFTAQGAFRALSLSWLTESQCSVQVDIDLPQIAVIGSQSAGKSSLIESISGITLPRAAGTCTRYYSGSLYVFLWRYSFAALRCPTECRLARSDSPWQCIVSLRRITGPDGQPLGQARTDRFGDVILRQGRGRRPNQTCSACYPQS
jgi:hypothetical protein